MKIEIKVDEHVNDTNVIIVTRQVDERIHALVKRISEDRPLVIAGFSGDTVRLLDQEEIYRIYAENGKVFCKTQSERYTLRLRLYELEARLDPKRFVRISNSEIINLKRVKGFDLSFTGTIRVALTNGETTFVSRRYMSKIKHVLGL